MNLVLCSEVRMPSQLSYRSTFEIAAPAVTDDERDTFTSSMTSLAASSAPCVNSSECSVMASVDSGEAVKSTCAVLSLKCKTNHRLLVYIDKCQD